MNLLKRETQSIDSWLDKPRNLPFLSVAWGGACGALMILKFAVSTSGPLIFVPYAILVIGFFLLVKKTEISYRHRFLAGVASFMTATMILYLCIIIILNPEAIYLIPFWGHLWRIGMMLGIAVAVNGAMTYLQRRFDAKLL